MSRGGLLTVLNPGYSPEAKALFSAMTTAPTLARRQLIERTIDGLKASGAWALMDVLYMCAAHADQAGRLNWKSPGQFACTNLTNAPTFTADRGFKGNGTDQGLDTGYNPSVVVGNKFLQDNAHMGIFCGDNITSTTFACGYLRAGFQPRTATGACVGRISSSSSDTLLAAPNLTDARVSLVATRNNAADFLAYRNGTQLANPARVSAALSNFSFTICALNNAPVSWGLAQVAAFHTGGHLSAAQIAALSVVINAYMTSVGVI